MVAHRNLRQQEVEPAHERVEAEVPPGQRLVVVEQVGVGVGEPASQRPGIARGEPAEAERSELARHREVTDGDGAAVQRRLDERPCPWRRAQVRAALDVHGGPLVLQPTRAIARKNVHVGLALAAALGGTFWLTGPAEDGFAGELDRLVRAAGVPVRRGMPDGVSMAAAYAACDAVVLPSSWEGFGLPLIESALHRRPIAVGDFPVARELAAFGFRWFSPADPGPLQAWLADPDHTLLDDNETVARRHFGLDALVRRLDLLLSGAPMCHHSGASTEGNTTACDCLTA